MCKYDLATLVLLDLNVTIKYQMMNQSVDGYDSVTSSCIIFIYMAAGNMLG